MAEKKTSKTISGWKKKKWFTIYAPEILKKIVIGETPANDASYLNKRTIKLSLMAITSDPKHQNFDIILEIDKITGLSASTRIKKYEMSASAIKRFVKRGRDRIDDSFVIDTKDGIKIRIKPLLITKENTTGSIIKKLRKYTKDLVIKQVRSSTYDVLMQDIISGKFTKQIKSSLNKIYPLKSFEIRAIQVLDFSQTSAVTSTAPEETPKKEEQIPSQSEKASISD